MLEDIQKTITIKMQQVKNERVLLLYLVCVGISIILGIFVKYGYEGFVSLIKPSLDVLDISGTSSINHSSFFSTSAAILSTVVAIIFSVLIFISQISYKYTLIEIFWSKETLILIMSYLGTIFLSLMMLETAYQFPILILILTFVCILSLFPFSVYLIEILYVIEVEKLDDEISSFLNANNESLALGKTKSLVNACKRSIKNNQLNYFLNIMRIFEKSIEKAKQKEMREFVKILGLEYFNILNSLIEKKLTIGHRDFMFRLIIKQIEEYVENCSDMLKCDDINLQAVHLKDIGLSMINSDFDDKYVDKIVDTLCNIFYIIQKKRRISRTLYDIFYNRQKKQVTENDQKQITEHDKRQDEIGCLEFKLEPNIIEYIGILAIELFNRKSELSSLTTSVVALFAIGAKAYQVKEKIGRSELPSSGTIIEQLKKIEERIGSDNFERLFNESKHSKKYIFREPELDKYLDTFKTYYNEEKCT